MKILFITHYGRLYGANRSLLDLVCGLQEKNITPHILSFEQGEVINAFQEKDIKVKVISSFPWIVVGRKELLFVPFRIIRDLLKFPYLLYWTYKLNPDIIYSKSSIFHTGILLALFLNKPHVWHVREFGWKDYKVNFILPSSLRRILFRKSTKLIAISEAIAKEVLKGFETQIIYNGIVDLANLSDKPKDLEITLKKPIVFSIIGQLMPTKGQMIAVMAFNEYYKKNKNIQMFIVGDGNIHFENELKEYISKHGLKDAVTFTGFIKDTESIYHMTDIFLMCSYSEAMGRVTVEALAHGIPVVGYAGGATAEIIKEGINGYLYHNFEDYVALSVIMEAMVKNPEIYTQLSTGALEHSKRFNKEEYVNTVYDELYKIYNLKN